MAHMPTSLLVTRFVFTVFQLLLTLMTYMSMNTNILAAIPIKYTAAQYEAVQISMYTAISIAVLLLCVEFVGMFTISLLHPAVAVIDIIFHCFGSIFMIIFIVKELHYLFMWYNIIYSIMIPVLVEFFLFMRICAVQKREFW
ncbi:hypothetical protein PAPYR_343 [Paratrimastix pyriformis]|uniref:Transmembrane protein 107 n=1 Tax=Paratrimastix pyriformis TaxID=342808 RepID=A0ABQ8V0C1_9EUKA|nr:hypothetical protein PAPYR_343 [Paratrimastix pyriformis]